MTPAICKIQNYNIWGTAINLSRVNLLSKGTSLVGGSIYGVIFVSLYTVYGGLVVSVVDCGPTGERERETDRQTDRERGYEFQYHRALAGSPI